MMMHAHLNFSALVDYWLGELDEEAEAMADEHLLACEKCGACFDEVVALANGIREGFARGTVHAFVTDRFVHRLEEQGIHVREYRVPRNGSVNCTVNANDQVLVARLEALLHGVTRVDVIREEPGPPQVYHDVPFDSASGTVLLMPRMATIRAMPSHIARVRLVSVEEQGERVLGEYVFNHMRSPS
jgi:hypothetical protein